MEVSGRKREAKSQNTDRLEDYIVCQPCFEDGNHLPAHGYCTDCEEHLCEVCFNSHLIPRPSKNHKLLGTSEMPKEVKNLKPKDECNELCKNHKGEVIKYYCQRHKQLGCGPCMTTGHLSCEKAVRYIPDISMGNADSDLCHEIRNKIESMKSETIEIKHEVKVNTEAIAEVSKDTIDAMQVFRNEIQTFFDELEKKVKTEIKEKQTENQQRMDSVSEACDTVANDLQCLTSDIEKTVESKRENQLFVALKQSEKVILAHDEKLKQAKHDVKFDQFEFVPNDMAVNMMKTLKSLGQIVIKKENKSQDLETSSEDLQSSQNKTDNVGSSNTQARLTPASIDIASTQDTKTCKITGITILSDGKLALADNSNNSVKILDGNYKMVSCVQLSSGPWNIAEVGRDEIAVTVPDVSQIQFMSVSGRLGRHIKIEGKCRGLVHSQGKLFVTVGTVTHGIIYRGKIMLIDINGAEIKRIYAAVLYHLAISPDHTTLYVSSGVTKCVTSLTLEGMVKAAYSDGDFGRSPGLTVDRGGKVYVCGDNSIHQLTLDCIKIQVLYQGKVSNTQAIAYNERENKLLISNNGGSEIKIVQLQLICHDDCIVIS